MHACAYQGGQHFLGVEFQISFTGHTCNTYRNKKLKFQFQMFVQIEKKYASSISQFPNQQHAAGPWAGFGGTDSWDFGDGLNCTQAKSIWDPLTRRLIVVPFIFGKNVFFLSFFSVIFLFVFFLYFCWLPSLFSFFFLCYFLSGILPLCHISYMHCMTERHHQFSSAPRNIWSNSFREMLPSPSSSFNVGM